jgi:hypothetical protein
LWFQDTPYQPHLFYTPHVVTWHNRQQAAVVSNEAELFNLQHEEIMKHFTTPNKLADKHPEAFTRGCIRYLLFNSYHNGLDKSGAITRIGRKILIDEEKFFAWIESQSNNGGSRGK